MIDTIVDGGAAALHECVALSHAGQLDASQRATLCVAHAEACMSMHRLDEALRSRRQALVLHRELGEEVAEGVDLREMARIEWFRGAIPEGKAHAAAIAVLSPLEAPRELAMAHATMAQLHLFDEAPAAALDTAAAKVRY